MQTSSVSVARPGAGGHARQRGTARAEGALYGTAANRKKQIWETFAALAN